MNIFDLAIAKKRGGGSGSGDGVTIKNQNKTFTENGSYAADSGYTGLGVVKVDVQPNNQDKNITANGTYRADSGYTGLGEVVVDVPPTPPNNQDITVKENGTYTAEDGYSGLGTVTVEVPTSGGSVSVSPKDVNFYDYDGTILHSYTVEEAQALTELPELPTQQGLICQGWNWTLDEIKAHNRAVDVGAMYITDDGKTRIYIRIPAESKLTVPLNFTQSEDNGVTIDWGDGSAKETFAGTGSVNTTHTYASIGDYVISLDVADTCILQTRTSTGSCTLLSSSKPYINMLYRLECGKNIKFAGYGLSNCSSLKNITISNGVIDGVSPTHLFNGCSSLLFVTIPRGATNLNTYTFGKCSSLKGASLPNTVTVMQANLFYNTYALASAIIPSSVTKFASNLFYSCYPLLRVIIPNSITSIPSNCFYQCTACGLYDFTRHTSVPTLENTNAFSGIPSDCEIRVPASLYDEWIAATNWSTYASNIVAV